MAPAAVLVLPGLVVDHVAAAVKDVIAANMAKNVFYKLPGAGVCLGRDHAHVNGAGFPGDVYKWAFWIRLQGGPVVFV